MVLAKEGVSVGSLPVLPEARQQFIIENGKLTTGTEEINNFRDFSAFRGQNEFPLPHSVVDYINALPAKEFTEEEIE